MKRIISLFLCVSLLLPAQPGGVFAAGGSTGSGFAAGVYTDEMIAQMTEQYRDMDIDAIVKMMSKSGQVMDEKTIEAMRDMQKMAREGTLGDYLRSFGAADEAAFTAVKINVTAPAEGEILAIAKKYYDYHSTALNGSLKGEFTRDVGSVAFDGKANETKRAESLCNTASTIAMLKGDGDYAVGCAAAAIGWSQGYARGAGTLAAILEMAGFINDRDRLSDATKLAAYAISIDKSDADLYVTLGRLLYVQNDLDGALEAVEAALAIEPGNSAALNLKIEILNKKGGTFLSAAASKIGDDRKENDGEMSKRITKLENAAKGMKRANDDDSKEEALRKLEQLYTLEPLTPADMAEGLFPSESAEVRKRVNTVSAEDRAMLTKNFPVFPNGLYRTAGQVYAMNNDIQDYFNWVTYKAKEQRSANVYLPASAAAEAARAARGGGFNRIIIRPDATPLDYQWTYNYQIVHAAEVAFNRYTKVLFNESFKSIIEVSAKHQRKIEEVFETYKIEIAAAERLPEPQKSAAIEAATIKRKLAENEASGIKFKEVMPIYSKLFDEAKKQSERLWEKMLPFARATEYPEDIIFGLLELALEEPWDIIYNLACGNMALGITPYNLDVSPVDLEEAKEALAALQEMMVNQQSLFYDVTNGFTISTEFGPFEFKLSNNKIEVEYVDGAACKVAFDWKSKELEVGVGVGHKAKLGMVKGAQVGVEAKAYVNFVLDLRNNEVTDIYLSAEAKGSAGSFEAGGQARVSLMGKGADISSAAKRKLGSFAIEHERELIKTSFIIWEFNYKYCSRNVRGARLIIIS
ncbi:MAG: hypothetical protein FWF87_05670 [Synergistaceae bacterium]|nr:hypothetical protein [Synergistaceae bacterium]